MRELLSKNNLIEFLKSVRYVHHLTLVVLFGGIFTVATYYDPNYAINSVFYQDLALLSGLTLTFSLIGEGVDRLVKHY